MVAFEDGSGVAGERSDTVEVIVVHKLTISYDAARREDGEQFIHGIGLRGHGTGVSLAG
jgi:hypothetical protein